MKLKPLLVYYSENPRALKNIAKCSPPLLWKSKPPNMGYTGRFPGVIFPLLYPRCRKILLGEGCPIQHSFATQQCPGPLPIDGQLSSQHQSSAFTTEYYHAYSTSGPRSYSDFQEITFTLQFLLGGKGKWWIMNNLVTILKGLFHLQSHKTYWLCLACGFDCHQEWDLEEPLPALCLWFLWIWEDRKSTRLNSSHAL